MSDDMSEKIKQIADMLGGQNSAPNIPDNVKGLLGMLMSNSGSKEEEQEDSPPQKSRSNESTGTSEADDFADMARKMKKAMGKLSSSGNDPRVNLLNAIRPYLNKNRQRKLQTCIKLMRIGSLTQMLDDSEERPV